MLFFLQGIDISVDCTGINVNVRSVGVWSPGDRGERWVRADWDAKIALLLSVNMAIHE